MVLTDAQVLEFARQSGLTCDQVYEQLKTGENQMANVATVVVSSEWLTPVTVSNVTKSGAVCPSGCASVSIGDKETLVKIDPLYNALLAVDVASLITE